MKHEYTGKTTKCTTNRRPSLSQREAPGETKLSSTLTLDLLPLELKKTAAVTLPQALVLHVASTLLKDDPKSSWGL